MSKVMDKLSRDVEQMEAASETAAKMAAIFFKTSIDRGFNRVEALQLTIVWLTNILNGVNK